MAEPFDESKRFWVPEDDYDVILLGTGFIESVVAGAMARSGKKVLHIESAANYGGTNVNLNLQAFTDYLEEQQLLKPEPAKPPAPVEVDGQHEIANYPPAALVTNVSTYKNYATTNVQASTAAVTPTDSKTETTPTTDPPAEPPTKPKPEINSQDLFAERVARRYNLDVAPKLIWGNSDLVSTLIRSGTGRYLEFKCLEHCYMFIGGSFQKVPCSKGDIFSNKFISLLEKRVLMKFIDSVLNDDQRNEIVQNYATKPFVELLKDKKLSDSLQSFILYSIALHDGSKAQSEELSTIEGLTLLGRYFKSLGAYGATPFLASLYGSGEISQAYCRLSAVYGGIYLINTKPTKIFYDKETGKACAVETNHGQKVTCKNLISNYDHLPFYTSNEYTSVSRCICIVDDQVVNDKIIMGVIPPGIFSHEYPVKVIQLDSGMHVCDKGKYVLYFSTRSTGTAEEDLRTTVESFTRLSADSTDTEKPLALWAVFYNQKIRKGLETPENVYMVDDPDSSLSFDSQLDRALEIFKGICGEDAEFIEQVPDPNDVQWTEETEGGETEKETEAVDQKEGEPESEKDTATTDGENLENKTDTKSEEAPQ